MPTAQIQFSQIGSPTGGVGQSVIGYLNNTNVVFTDAAGAGATSWAWTIESWPGPLASAPTVNNASTQTANATPTSDGVYIVKVVRTDPGPTVTTDTKFFAIGDADYGTYIPSANQTGNMTNVDPSPTAAQKAGWWGRADGNNVWLDNLFRFLRSRIGRFIGLQATVNFSSGSPSTVPITDGVDKPWRVINMTGTAVYTEELVTTGSPPQGKRFKYRVNMTAGAGNFVLHNGVGGSTLHTIVAPPSGTTSYGFEVAFDGTNWTRTLTTELDQLALVKSVSFDGVVGLQMTQQTVATRIGSVRLDPSKYPSNAQIVFQAAVDTTGPQVTVQLYNLTDSAIVASSVLTSTSTTTSFVTSAALTLPGSQKDYEVQMFMASGGGPSDHVDCSSARILLMWG
jgi:hypothetical protein